MIFRLEYGNRFGDTVRIDITTPGLPTIVEVEGTGDPFRLKYTPDVNDKSFRFLTTSANINIYETPEFNIDTLKTSSETDIKVERYINGVRDWVGFVIPDFFSKEIRGNAVVSMTASDRISTLKGVTLSDLPERISIRNLAVLCLGKTGLDLPLKTMVGFTTQSAEIGFNEYFRSEILTQRFSDTKGRSISCYDILKSILVTSFSTLVQRHGEWYIVNKMQHEIGSGKLYSSENQSSAWSDHIHNFSEITKGAMRSIIPVAASVGIFHEFGGGRLHPENYDFSQDLSGWSPVGGFSASTINKQVTGYKVSGSGIYEPEYGDETENRYLVNNNPYIRNNNPVYLQSQAIDIPYEGAGSIKVEIDINGVGPKVYPNTSECALTVAIVAIKGSEVLTLDHGGKFVSMPSINPPVFSKSFERGSVLPDMKAEMDTKSMKISGTLEANGLQDYKIYIRIYGNGSGRTILFNFVSIRMSNSEEAPKGNIYKREQGSSYTNIHDIETTIFGDYITGGLNGYFYDYPIDDTSSLFSPYASNEWRDPTDPDSEPRPLLYHATKQRSRMFSVAHDLISGEIDIASFDPLAIFVDCNNKRYSLVSATIDTLRCVANVDIEEIAYNNNVGRDYIYSYFGEGEQGVKSVGGIASGTGGGGSGGGLTNEQIDILNEVAGMAHTHENKVVLDKIKALLTFTDSTVPSDENIMSSLRVLAEIIANNEELKKIFLSKVEEDEAKEVITFLKGIVADGTSYFDELVTSGKVTAEELEVKKDLIAKSVATLEKGFKIPKDGKDYGVDENALALLKHITLEDGFQSPVFIPGIGGEGVKLSRKEGTVNQFILEIQDLVVNGKLSVNTVDVLEWKHVGAGQIYSHAGFKIDKVEELSDRYRVYPEKPEMNTFRVQSQALCQQFNTDAFNSKRYWRVVIAVAEDRSYIDLSKTIAEAGSDVPEVGDNIFAYGFRGSDNSLKGAIIISSYGDAGPYIQTLRGIDSFDVSGKTQVFIGNETILNVDRLTIKSGSGDWYRVPTDKGKWTSGTIAYYYDRFSFDGSLWLCLAQPSTTEAPSESPLWEKQVERGEKGDKGAKGDTGAKGVPGEKGADGIQRYTWIRYADTAAGGGMSNDPTGKKYIGLAYNKTTATESNTPSDYTWSLIKGEDGAQGIKGDKGADGQSQYTHIRYSVNANGNPMAATPSSTTKYIGIAVTTSSTAPSGYASYTWSKYVGEDGNQGIPGTPGADGVTYYTWIKYATTPTSGISDSPAGKPYIGIAHNKTTATESNNYSDYTWSLIKGDKGDTGAKGETGVPGVKGDDGVTYYTWLKYSDNADGTGLYDVPTASTKYIGIAVNKTTATESTNKADYTWSKFRGEDGEDGVSVLLVDPEFAVNTSTVTPPTSGWQTTAPTLTGNQQLWTRTKTTYSSGNPTYSTPANITPKTGSVGQGVDSIVEEFAISASKVTAPTSGWSTIQPAWSSGMYIWSRIKITYKNPTSIEYAGTSVSSEWEAINDLQIGGRNLIREVDIMSLGSNASKGIDDFGPYIRFITSNSGSPRFTHIKYEDNTQYTLSIEASVETGSYFYWYFAYTDGSNSGLYTTITINTATPVIRRATSAVNKTIDYIAYTWVEGGYRRIYNIKLEKGNKATDWTPAIEDVEAEITRVENDAQFKIDTVNGRIDLQASKITTVEGEISGAVQRITANESAISAQATQIQAKVSRTEYDSNKNAVSQQISSLDIKADGISAKVDDLQIGGRNLLPNNIWENGHILVGSGEDSDVDRNERLRTFEFITIENSSHYTLSWDSNSLRTAIIYEFNSEKQWIRTNADEYRWYETPNPFTFQTHQDSSFLKVIVDSVGIGNINPSDFQSLRVKLEKGNKATDWTPAPEDLPNKLLATGIDIENKLITLTADKTVFKSNSGAVIAVFNSAGTKIIANAIELTGSDSISLKINNDTATAKSEAISTASSDATTKANNARTQAVNTAATDATTKANNAQSAAISAAATDATTKANSAKADAISAAATDASSKANAAQIAAINDITSKLSGTGINMQDKLLTLYSGASGGTGQGKVVILGDNFSVDAAGKIKAVDGEFTGKITAVEGKIGNWTIDQYGLRTTSTGSNGGQINIELSGGYFLRINQSDSTMMSIRADSKRAISIYTQGSSGVGIDLTGQTGSTAISSFGSHKFVQRNGEEWNAPGVIAAGWFYFENGALSGFSYWKISPIALYAERMSDNEVRISHTLNHADYIPLVWREQGQAFLFGSPTSTEFRIDGIGQGTRGGRICFLMIGRNRS